MARDLEGELGEKPLIEAILSRTRLLAKAVGSSKVYGYDGPGFKGLGEEICNAIGQEVGVELPKKPNAYTELAAWVGGTNREHAVEIFTPNYDLLLEEAFERARLPYYDFFTGGLSPFFNSASVANDELPPVGPSCGSYMDLSDGKSRIKHCSRQGSQCHSINLP